MPFRKKEVIIATFKYPILQDKDNQIKKVSKKMFNSKKSSLFADMHPGLMFIIGLIIGAVVVYFLVKRGIIPTNLLPI